MFLVEKYVKIEGTDVKQGIRKLSPAGGWDTDPGPQGSSGRNVPGVPFCNNVTIASNRQC